jgi:hypothetical protein
MPEHRCNLSRREALKLINAVFGGGLAAPEGGATEVGDGV